MGDGTERMTLAKVTDARLLAGKVPGSGITERAQMPATVVPMCAGRARVGGQGIGPGGGTRWARCGRSGR